MRSSSRRDVSNEVAQPWSLVPARLRPALLAVAAAVAITGCESVGSTTGRPAAATETSASVTSRASALIRTGAWVWAQLGGVYQATDADAGDAQGTTLAVAGDHAVIGAPLDDEGGTDAGAAYVFELDSQGVWRQQVKWLGAAAGAKYGTAVAIDSVGGDKRIVIGAPGDGGGKGSASWLRGRGRSWTPEATIMGAGRFGASVAVSSGRVLVGGPGAASDDGTAILYESDVTATPPWAAVATIKGTAGGAEELGTSVALDGEVAVVGSPADSSVMMAAGSVGVYGRTPAGAWNKTATLKASDAAKSDRFGDVVSVSGLTVAVGASAHSMAAGAAYVFTGPMGAWAEQAKLHAVSGLTLSAGDLLGGSLFVSGNLLVAGAVGSTVGGNAGAGVAYLFSRVGATWTLAGTLAPRTSAAQEGFGSALSLDAGQGHLLIGAAGNDTGASNAGGFYDLIQRKPNGEACALAVDCASDFCVDGVCCNSACGGGVDSDCQACSAAKGAAANGVCGAVQAAAAVVCRPAAGVCDQAEKCDGSGTTCPTDAYLDGSVTCRARTGACDIAETCSGNAADCPADIVQNTDVVCRDPAGPCDVAERCDGQAKACPADQLAPRFAICSVPASDCHRVLLCSGTSTQCPTTDVVADGTPCATGSCQAGLCRAESDVAVSLAGPPDIEPGRALPFVFSVMNFGPVPAGKVVLTVTMTGGTTVRAYSGAVASCQQVAESYQCVLSDLPVGQMSLITLQLVAPPEKDRMTVSAVVTPTVTDPNQGNNSASVDQNLLSSRISGGGVGIGCSATGAGRAGEGGTTGVATVAGLALALLAASVRRRRLAARLMLLVGGLTSLLAPSVAEAQNRGFQLNRFEPTAAGEWSFQVDHPWFNRRNYLTVGITMDYAHNSLVHSLVRPDGSVTQTQSLLEHSLTGHLDLALAVRNRVLVTASLPVSLVERGQDVPGSGFQAAMSPYASDPRLGVTVRLYGNPYGGAFAASLGGQVWLPLRAIVDSLPEQASDQAVRGALRLVLGGLSHHLMWSANIGALIRPEARIGNVSSPYGRTTSHELQLGVALAYADVARRFAIGPEAILSAGLLSNAFQPTSTSLEFLLGAHYNIARIIQVSAAGGLGVWREAGTPDARALLRLAYAPMGRGSSRPAERHPTVRDRDRDGVADDADRCPDEPQGTRPDPKMAGCPLRDRDGDGVQDAEDLCPDQPSGENPDPARRGCPASGAPPVPVADQDGDGVPDGEDLCPSIKAGDQPDPKRRGCPGTDRDGDGVLDIDDQCPDQPNTPVADAARKGCPVADKDGDGVLDNEDQCPDQPNTPTADPTRKGCPAVDRDGDGIFDHEDQCPLASTAGLPDPLHKGCPLSDSDRDMVPDGEDACPDKPGAPDKNPKRNGCPNPFVEVNNGRVLLKQVIAFKFNSDAILPQSNLILTALANVLRDTPAIKKVRIEGHTDNAGNPDANLDLSRLRAESVMRFLTDHGIEASRLEAQGLGDTRPIADNATQAGRGKNRRVEFIIVDPAQ